MRHPNPGTVTPSLPCRRPGFTLSGMASTFEPHMLTTFKAFLVLAIVHATLTIRCIDFLRFLLFVVLLTGDEHILQN